MNLIKMLAAPVAVLSLWAAGVQAATDAEIAERLKPVGEVCVAGQECKGVATAAAAAGGGARSGDDVVAKYCNACHGTGLLNAPKVGDSAAWKTRADAKGGLDGLLQSALSGLNAMPPKGTCADCSDDELKAAIGKMSGL
ncbi:c-type cytochrome [Azotobacter vinelandii DJ]|uniref:c-type cytochrome n=1 Tax=Azotobacter sp. NL3 TaxID=3083257 RepID=UPI0000459F0D|nr:c-type cytochrome [Azotobacter vinelandii]WKN21692.1 c-type cytochrome [Azotobacter vinelandii]GLK60626.1 cytochrome C5 [Azotobacter vinelandii]SFX00659.1 Cytochrome c5 [Azotobacter vinelandii]